MRFNELSWKTSDGIQMYGGYWQPPDPAGIICLIHGLGEHCRRYEPVAEFFAHHGWATFTFDQRGHGRSGGKRGVTPSYDRLLDDIQLLFENAQILFPERPCIVYGHSMGGNQAANFVLRRKPDIKALVLSAAFFRLPVPVSTLVLTMGNAMNRIYPAFTQSNGLDVKGISRDLKEVEKYLSDPLNHDRISVCWGLSAKDAGEWAIAHASKITIPTLVSHGSADRLTAFEGSQAFAQNNPNYITFQPWEGWYHELHHEPERQKYLSFVANWLNKTVQK